VGPGRSPVIAGFPRSKPCPLSGNRSRTLGESRQHQEKKKKQAKKKRNKKKKENKKKKKPKNTKKNADHKKKKKKKEKPRKKKQTNKNNNWNIYGRPAAGYFQQAGYETISSHAPRMPVRKDRDRDWTVTKCSSTDLSQRTVVRITNIQDPFQTR